MFSDACVDAGSAEGHALRPVHHIIAARLHQVPKPFRAFAVRSDEPCHAFEARAPLGQLHLVRTAFIDAECMARIVAQGQ